MFFLKIILAIILWNCTSGKILVVKKKINASVKKSCMKIVACAIYTFLFFLIHLPSLSSSAENDISSGS